MALSKVIEEPSEVVNAAQITSAQKRRNRRKKLHAAKVARITPVVRDQSTVARNTSVTNELDINTVSKTNSYGNVTVNDQINKELDSQTNITNMSSKEGPNKSRDDVIAAREAKKLAKQKAKSKDSHEVVVTATEAETIQSESIKEVSHTVAKENVSPAKQIISSPKSKDEVDRASVKNIKIEKAEAPTDKPKEQILTERAAKKAAKQVKKKAGDDVSANTEMTVKDVVETLKEIKNVAKDVQNITAKVSAIHFEAKKPEESSKSKAELKAERRAKQEAQRAAKQAAEEKTVAKPVPDPAKLKETIVKPIGDVVKEKSPKLKSTDKSKLKVSANRVNWFQHLYTEHDKEALKRVALNSNLHPAIIKLGVQLSSRVIEGSNARCIALFDALKKMVKDYTLPAKTEFARGLESHLATSLDYLWAMRQPSASQTNAVKYFRHQLTQLPNNVDEFDAKKSLQEEIDKYIEDQIDKAGEAISMAVRNKISTGDNILTFGCSSLIERILREAWQAKLQFHTVVVGDRVHSSAREMLRRLAACGLPCTYVDITAISFVMKTINKVVVGAAALLANGCVVGAAGVAQVALVARACNVPVLVACETHKVSERVQTDAFVYNEIGDPDALIDKTDDNSPLKDWRSNPNLTPLNLTYDVTPPSLVTAVVTERAILPCTSAPVVLRTKLSEYGI